MDRELPVPPPAPPIVSEAVPPARRRWRVVPAALLVVAIAAAAGAFWTMVATERRRSTALSERVTRLERTLRDATSSARALRERVAALEAGVPVDLVDLVDRVRPSVFIVRAGPSQGTAFVVRSVSGRSLLITNFHVVAPVWLSGGRTVQLRQDDRSRAGRILRVDRRRDLAVVAVEDELVALPVGSPPEVGDRVVIVGAPFGLESTVGDGIVSAIRARFIQFSAPISPGDSGAPLLDARGEVVAIAARKIVVEGAEGLGFAIPISSVCSSFVDC